MTAFEVWAPAAERVRLRLGPGVHELSARPDGWWRTEVGDVEPGSDYAYLLDDDTEALPDPRSRRQPYGVHGPSRVYDQAAFRWTDDGWTGRALPGSVLYEMHVGTFTPGATFDAAVERLDHLVALGVDLVEILPVNAVNGTHNWGYDGVGWYAVHEPYGGPDGLKRFVDACHGRGIGVVLDVVYNHLGPSGNYLPRFGPYLKQGRNTWGDLVNLDGPDSDPVRRYIIDNALMWLRDYHVDALRLDAVHALADTRATHLLEELSVEVDALASRLGRPLSLIAESDLNDPRLVTPRAAGGYGLTAQWDDDVHHSVHALLTGERQGYYADFGSTEGLAKVLTRAFFHDGTYSTFRRRHHGRPVDRRQVPGYRFVAFLQDHDQVGNRATGDRISATLSPGLCKVGAMLILTSPFTPMLFMGEEWAAGTPWQFFTSHPESELGAAVAAGRRAEFAAHGWPPGDVPDPQDPSTYERSILDWSELDKPAHAEILRFYRKLIALRRSRPELADPRLDRVRVDGGQDWLTVHRGRYRVVVNLAPVRRTLAVGGVPLDVPLATEPGFVFARREITLPAESAAVVACVPAG
ncbi:malto-oligosyltrehalose trehalohydrolase [Actinocatenispora rupis]|uniref:Malto-oligosyltrehalose trehalohydrolase n=1 Tax=Actinocatenispora rupis TaxID=519421 RepID=A0A8J3JEY2_9ACTN|nr:malto-oligosyltrehalose trehalohydrolase [Actinocatenispora rupis]GID15207.1 malto-oligosyltrehalose trehalohydrolase [Actinocatenispora rupis]